MDKKRIIIVEDDAVLRETLVEFLSLENLDVVGVGSAGDCYQAMAGVPFDLAIVDIGLPDKTGFEVVEHLRANTSMGIIVLTAREAMTDKIRGYKAGADHYFVKPMDHRELTAVVHSLIDRTEPSVPAPVADLSPTATQSQSAEWILDTAQWTIEAPSGKLSKLTEKEKSLLHLLIQANGEAVPQKNMHSALGYQGENLYSSRALSVMVARLRKKVRESCGVELPIRSVRSVGYSFPVQAHLKCSPG